MRIIFASLLCLASVLFPAFGSAEDQPVVVELFTSQGCSSCPPADAHLHRLAKQPNVIALALHVDYWDYIGWKDSFANPNFTERQRAYAQVQNERMIYTPQFMINGMENFMGNPREDVDGLIHKYQTMGAALSLSMQRFGSSVDITLSDALYYGPYDVHLVTVSPKQYRRHPHRRECRQSYKLCQCCHRMAHVGHVEWRLDNKFSNRSVGTGQTCCFGPVSRLW